MTEPTYEELKAKVAELEKKGPGRRTGALEYRVGEKGGVSVYGLGRFPGHALLRTVDTVTGRCAGPARISG